MLKVKIKEKFDSVRLYGQMDGWIWRMDWWIYGFMDGRMDEWMDRWIAHSSTMQQIRAQALSTLPKKKKKSYGNIVSKTACINQSNTINLIMSEQFMTCCVVRCVYKHCIGESKWSCHFKQRSRSKHSIQNSRNHQAESNGFETPEQTCLDLKRRLNSQHASPICLLFRLISFQHSVTSANTGYLIISTDKLSEGELAFAFAILSHFGFT